MGIDGITIRTSHLVPTGTFVLERRGRVVDIGKIARLPQLYQLGDVLVVSQDTWEALQAEFARDVTPKPSLPTPARPTQETG